MSNDFSLRKFWRSKAQTSRTRLTEIGRKRISPRQKTLPKFSQGDEVIWAKVPAHDYGVVCEGNWTNESASCKTPWGWHYLVRLHSNSQSYPFCKEDWAFEKDLELLSEFKKLGGESLEPRE